eukprot:595809-Prymnesium_polylepis.1
MKRALATTPLSGGGDGPSSTDAHKHAQRSWGRAPLHGPWWVGGICQMTSQCFAEFQGGFD